MEQSPSLSAELYNEAYYLKTLPGIEHLDDPDLIDQAVPDTIRFGKIVQGNNILDFGCGRGACALALAQQGCTVLGVDYSPHAIQFADKLKKQFPKEVRNKVRFQRMRTEQLSVEAEFDVIIFNQIYEHLHNWELENLLPKFKQALKPGGRLVISTPNLNYIRYLYPIKRLVNLPTKMIKESLRVLRGKSKHASSVNTFLKEIFKIRYPESEHTRLHINLQTPWSMKQFLERQGFRTHVVCIDRHTNPISLLTRRWWGETIWGTCFLLNPV